RPAKKEQPPPKVPRQRGATSLSLSPQLPDLRLALLPVAGPIERFAWRSRLQRHVAVTEDAIDERGDPAAVRGPIHGAQLRVFVQPRDVAGDPLAAHLDHVAGSLDVEAEFLVDTRAVGARERRGRGLQLGFPTVGRSVGVGVAHAADAPIVALELVEV